MGRYCAQDCAAHPDDEEQDSDSYALESGGMIWHTLFTISLGFGLKRIMEDVGLRRDRILFYVLYHF